MPQHVLMSEIEIIADGGRRRRWTAAEKVRIRRDAGFRCQHLGRDTPQWHPTCCIVGGA